MSRIVGLVQADGIQVDRTLLRRLTQFLADRRPNTGRIWSQPSVGLGHAHLLTTPIDQEQPCSLDGQVWIVADARIDGRAELIASFAAHGQQSPTPVTDAALILRAYQIWGIHCVEHLLGDFVFALWDQRQQHLFCARDHFGVKPFYYAALPQGLIFSNTLNCVRAHPVVSSSWNPLAIADFLAFGCNQDVTTTTFQQIQRLPPAHTLVWSEGQCRLQRYWTLPLDGEIRYRQPLEYVEQFQALLTQAVGDRLGSSRTSLFLSGGLDSGAIAATACDLVSPTALQALTAVYDRLIPDQERHYAGLVATALNLPIQYLVTDEIGLYTGWDRPELQRPEPIAHPLLLIFAEQLRRAAEQGCVALTGEGGDPVFLPSSRYFWQQLRTWHWRSLAQGVWQYYQFTGRLPRIGLRTQLRQWRQPEVNSLPYPAWLHPDLLAQLQQRQLPPHLAASPEAMHPTRPEAYATLTLPTWPALFENADPGATRYLVEVRHPLFDVRLVNYLLAIPVIPWFVQKELVRVAMKGKLPEAVRRRPKTPLAGNPVYDLLQQAEGEVITRGERSPYLTPYLHPHWVASLNAGQPMVSDLWTQINRLSFVRWCDYSETINLKLEEEHVYEIPGCSGYEEKLYQS